MKRAFLFALPVVLLLLHLLQVPVLLPSALLPRRVIVPPEARSHPEFLFDALKQYPVLHLPAGQILHTLQRSEISTREDLNAALANLPHSPSVELEQTLRQAVSALPSFTRILLLLDHTPAASETGTLRRLQEEGLPPVEVRVIEPPYDPLFLACSSTYSTQESSLTFDLLFAPRVKEYRSLRVTQDGAPLRSLMTAELGEMRELHASLASPDSGEVTLGLTLQGSGGSLERELKIRTPGREAPNILMVTTRPASHSFLDALYRLKRASPSEVLRENFASYPLIVFDGVPLREFGPRLTETVTEIHRRNSASLFFVSDGPGFGKKGDNPALERILPAELSPRSLRYLPDLGILILLDISASMMGEKLSLAKVSTLELLKNLKDTDRVSILTFWDQYRFLHGFEEKRVLSSQAQIAPLIAQGGTDLFKAFEEGLGRLSALDMDERHVLIISDGKTKEADFEGAIRRARLRDISVSTLAVGEEVNAELLSRIARDTGGRYYRVQNIQQIPSIIFEDRKEIARSSFALDRFPIFGPERSRAGEVTGMSLFTPKPGKPILYRNQYEDPLAMIERRDGQLTILFLSDLYGTYTSRFFSNPSVVQAFRTALDTVLRRHQVTVRVGEASRALSITLSGEGLVAPRLELYAAERLIAERSMKPGPFQTYHAEFSISRPDLYTAVLYSQGAPINRLPVYFNGLMEGLSADAPRELLRYRSRAFLSVPPGNLFLVLFFLASVASTWLARRAIAPGTEKA
jgi:uncharacterized protein YegL